MIDILNEELKNETNVYPIRNSYYKINGKEWFNELSFVLLRNKIYEIDVIDNKVDTLTEICLDEETKIKVKYDNKYKFIYKENDYVYEDDTNIPVRDKWEF